MTNPTVHPGHVPPIALSIAGSDSGGGAGIQADLATFFAHGVFGTTAITAVTAQNTIGVSAIFPLDERAVASQIEAVLDDLAPGATKTGMLASTAIVDVVAGFAKSGALGRLVVDPVLVATTGARLAEGDVRDAYLRLIASAEVVTPNLAEASYLTGSEVRDLADMRRAAEALVDSGTRVAVVKGGHLAGFVATDVVFDGEQMVELTNPMIRTKNVHGTGCTLSAAIASNLARGLGTQDAIEEAKRYVTRCVESSAAWKLGSGTGPLDHQPAGWTRP